MITIKIGGSVVDNLHPSTILDIKKIADGLIKKGLIITKPAPYGLQVSLNKEKLKEIEEFIKIVLGYNF